VIVESGAESIWVEVDGRGDGPAVVLTHGLGGNHASWWQQVPALVAAGYRVVTWDQRGFGRSTRRGGDVGPGPAQTAP
jgi:3-oxoadipate enol-lactonase